VLCSLCSEGYYFRSSVDYERKYLCLFRRGGAEKIIAIAITCKTNTRGGTNGRKGFLQRYGE
jgi:hypothetical protein